jgi:TRAP-type C4-dicarboxylate transport system permease small subunit
MGKVFKVVIKIFLIVVGGVMLVGGGICVASNMLFALPNLFHPGAWMYFILGGISALVAWGGWGMIKLAGWGKSDKRETEKD